MVARRVPFMADGPVRRHVQRAGQQANQPRQGQPPGPAGLAAQVWQGRNAERNGQHRQGGERREDPGATVASPVSFR